MIYRTPKQDIDAYYLSNALNQSSLKTIIGQGIQAFIDNMQNLASQEDELYYTEKTHFIIGHAVDDYMSMGEEYYLNNYHFSNVKKPGDSVLSIVNMVYDMVKGSHTQDEMLDKKLEGFQREIYDACNMNKYYVNRAKPSDKDLANNALLTPNHPDYVTWKNDTRWIDIVRKGSEYFEDLIFAGGKQVLSDEQNSICNKIISSFTNHPFVSDIFVDSEDCDLIYQLPIYFKIRESYCKALPDLIRINHKSKLITIVDIKTFGGYILNFNRNIKLRRYDFQLSFYYEAIFHAIKLMGVILGRDLSEYRINMPVIVAESTTKPGTPLPFLLSEELIHVGKHGSEDGETKGWFNAITEYENWKEHNFSLDSRLSANCLLVVDKDFKLNSY